MSDFNVGDRVEMRLGGTVTEYHKTQDEEYYVIKPIFAPGNLGVIRMDSKMATKLLKRDSFNDILGEFK